MERIPGASAMEWSIELDKGLRSKHQDERDSALEKIGPRLQQLSREPNITKSIAETYNLILGEDILFVNTIILRLCNAFKNGDNLTRSRILKIFLLELEQIKKKRRGYKGIFAKERVHNHEEILRRVKSVFHNGCSESKSLSLRVFGCMADFAKDSIEIRHLVLSCLKSSDPLVVKGAFFAASCFCLLSEEFSLIFLELLNNFIVSSSGNADVMLAAIRSFSKMRCSFGVSCKSYEVGRMLMMGLSEDRLKVEMLSSLTILASQYTILSSQQVDLLIQFVTPESSDSIKFRALKCLNYLFKRDKSHFTINKDVFSALLIIIEDKNLPIRLHCFALRILRKIFSNLMCNIPFLETINPLKIIESLLNVSHSSENQVKLLYIQVLVEIIHKFSQFQIIHKMENETKFANSVTLIIDNIVLMIEKLSDNSSKDLVEIRILKFKVLLGFILQIAKDYPLFVLDRVEILIQALVKENKNLVSCIFKFLNTYLSVIYEKRGIKLEDIYPTLKPLLDSVEENSYQSFCLSMKLYSNEKNLNAVKEINAIRLSKNTIEKRNYWEAYRIGIYSCCEGLWFNSAFIFKNLVGVSKSNIYNSWFESLLLLSGSESEIKLILFPKLGLQLVHELNKEVHHSSENMDIDDKIVDLRDFEEKFGTICSRLFSCEEILETNDIFYFQRWFVNLRVRFLEIILDLIRIINEIGNEILIGNEKIKLFLIRLFNCSTRLSQLVKECDLIGTSFLDMDEKSRHNISSFALICSLLAFCIAFMPDFPFLSNIVEVKFSISPFVEDLFERLHGLNSEMLTQLMQFMPLNSPVKNVTKSRVEKGNFGDLYKHCGPVCKFAISALSRIREECIDEGSINSFPGINRGLQLISEILCNCMEVNFRVPKHFFQVRPCFGAELFIFDSNPQNKPEISVLQKSHLSLNLCIQLKNIPKYTLYKITKLQCIISVKASHISHSRSTRGFDPHNAKEMVELNSILRRYVNGVSRKGNSVNTDESEGDFAWAFVSFEINERGLGFGSCVLDVSTFEEGLYQIKWQSCFVDEKETYFSLLPLNSGIVFSVKKP